MERYGGGSSRGSCRHPRQQQQQPWRSRRSHDVIHSASFSWPPRPYSCSFCKREFRSAQALGGHMNVHRRDRARLRNHSPPLTWDPPHDPNPTRARIPNLNSSPPPPPTGGDICDDDLPIYAPVCDRVFEGIVMKSNAAIGGRVEEDLDLELRLGYA